MEYSIPLLIREEEIKTTIKHHKNDYYFKRLKITNDDKEVEKSRLSNTSNRSVNWLVQPLWKTDGHYLLKLSMHIPYLSVILLIDIYPTKAHAHVYQETRKRFKVALVWNHFKLKSNQISIHSIKYYTVPATTWNFTKSQTQKNAHCTIESM